MRLFLKSRLTWSLVPLLSCALISPSARAVDTAALASTAVQGAMSMAMLSAMDTGFSAADCVCNADSTTCKTGAAGFCAALALNVVSMALGVAQALAAGNTQSAVQGQDGAGGYDANGNKIDVPTIPPFTPTTIPNTFKAECAKPNPPKYLCENNGFELAKIDLTKLKTLTETGKVVLTPEQLAGIDSAEKKIAAIQKGDYAGALGAAGAANGSDFSDYASQTSGRAGSAGALSSPGGGGDGTGGSVGWATTNGGKGGAFGGSGGAGGVGPTGAYLDATLWNGQLDAIDPNTGKSLTLWQRATRRYMGTPDGQRGYTLARIESLRKKATQKIAAAAETTVQKKRVAQQEEAPEYRPSIVSPKEFSKH